MATAILSLQNITVRNLEQVIFNDLSFQLNKGEHWALVGESGSGKSALLPVIAGKFNIVGGSIEHRHFDEHLKTNPDTSTYLTHHKLIALVQPKHSFRNLSNTTDFYY